MQFETYEIESCGEMYSGWTLKEYRVRAKRVVRHGLERQ